MHRGTLSGLGNALGFYNDEPEAVAHELAHSILLFGRAFIGCADANSLVIKAMTDYAANQHEIKAIALQHAGMRALRRPQALRSIVKGSAGCFRGEDRRTLLTIRSIMRAVEARSAAPQNVARFVQIVKRFDYYMHAP